MSKFVWYKPSTWITVTKEEPVRLEGQPISVSVPPNSVIILKRHAARLARLYELQATGYNTQEIDEEVIRRKFLLQAEKLEAPNTLVEAQELLKKLGG